MNFQQKLNNIVKKNNSLLCIGLDPELDKLPKYLLKSSDPIFEFNKAITNQTADLVCSYKPNIAFYEAYGIEGLKSLKKTIEYLQKNYPQIPVILDAKRGDIGNSSKMYAKACFEYWEADAVTLTIFTGKEGIDPFLAYKERYAFLYLRSTNTGAKDFQDITINNHPLFQVWAQKISKWREENFGIIAASTYLKELKMLRDIFPDRIFLVPGVGAQEGTLKDTARYGITKAKEKAKAGLIINVSRGIIYAENPREEAKKFRLEINEAKQ